jgi:hypothetical protein
MVAFSDTASAQIEMMLRDPDARLSGAALQSPAVARGAAPDDEP